MSIESIITETEEYMYFKFEEVCMKGNCNDMETFIKTFSIDVNKEEGYFIQLIALRNDVELLQLLLRYGADVHVNDEGILAICACNGYLEIVEFLVEECKCDYTQLYKTTAYSNCARIKQYFDSINNGI